ncbi:MAG: hypothetical protein J6S57_03590 [Alphaproteobacteria bacterium]|nr:hypothetical protein [Alphaproteobacteria bacterium]
MVKKAPKKMPVKKSGAKTAPIIKQEHGCGDYCMCGCHKHGTAHIVKHIIIWAIIFALGMACGKMMNCNHHKKMHRKMQPVFTNGCLDLVSIKCPKMSEEIIKADVNGDGCISVEEYKAWKKANKTNMYKKRKGMRAGFYGPQKAK